MKAKNSAQVLNDADMNKKGADETVLVEGTTSIPKIRQLVKEFDV